MLKLFRLKHPAVTSATPIQNDETLIKPESSRTLMATPRRQRLLEHIWQRTSLSRKQFAVLYLAPLERYAELVQQFPASEGHHHSYPGGMLDHGLEVVAYALKLRQSYLLPTGTTPEDQVTQSEVWTAITAYSALLHDIGKIAVDLHIEDTDGLIWHPWHTPLSRPYRFRYNKNREYRLHNAAAGLLYSRLLGSDILDWISSYPEAWSAMLYVLAGQYEHAGVLGELVIQADRASVAQELGGDPTKAVAAPKHALQRKLLEGLRYLLKEELKLNQPQASDGWLTADSLWLVSKTVSDKLRAHLLSQGIDGIPANNTAVFNVLQDHGMLQPTSDGKAIWRATITSDTGWSHSFTLLRLAPALIWESDDRPTPFAGTVLIETEESSAINALTPSDANLKPPSERPNFREAKPNSDGVDDLLNLFNTPNTVSSLSDATDEVSSLSLLDELHLSSSEKIPSFQPTMHPLPVMDGAASAAPSGEHFMTWLRQSILSHKLVINDTKALIHTLDNTAYLVTPSVFQRYAQEHLQVAYIAKQDKLADWQWVQKRFEKLQLHRKKDSGLNIWTCEVAGPRKSRRLHGYLLQDPKHLFDEVPPDNPYLSLTM